MPGFQPYLPDIRKEMAGYCTSTRRLDDMVGVILNELAEAGRVDDTIVVFLSDHGMSAPFAKTNCYEESTRTPLIVRWVRRGCRESSRPTAHELDGGLAADFARGGWPAKSRPSGRAFVPAAAQGWNAVWSRCSLRAVSPYSRAKPHPMRSVITHDHVYVFNAWSNGKRTYNAEPMAGLSYRAMKRAAKKTCVCPSSCTTSSTGRSRNFTTSKTSHPV